MYFFGDIRKPFNHTIILSTNMSTHFRPTRRFNCSFCKENGHNVKSCKTLAAVECGYCHELGHTTRHCGKLAAKKQRRHAAVKVLKFSPDADGFVVSKKTMRAPIRKSKKTYNGLYKLNSFSCLEDVTKTSRPQKKQELIGQWNKPLTFISECKSESVNIKYPDDSALLKRRRENRVAQLALEEEKTPEKKPVFQRKRYIGSWADAADDEFNDESDDEVYLFLC